MSEPSLRELEEQRDRLYARLAAAGDFRRGSVTENYRRCGKANCACAQPGHPGHGPRFLWTRSVPGSRTRGRQLAPGEVEKVRRELAGYQQFAALDRADRGGERGDLRGRPAAAPAAGAGPAGAAGAGRRKRGLRARFAAEAAAEVERLAALAARCLRAGEGLAAVELAIRTAMTRLGAGLLEDLLALDAGYGGPAVDCGAGHQARFVSYRDRRSSTRCSGRSPCAAPTTTAASARAVSCPATRSWATVHASLSPGLRSMAAHAATAVPFARAAALLAELAGVSLTIKRVERSAEADGAAACCPKKPNQRASWPAGPSCSAVRWRHAVYRGRRDRGADDAGRDRRRPGKADDGRAQYPGGETGLPVHPDQVRREGAARRRPGLGQLPGQLPAC